MQILPESIQNLIDQFSRLPGIGSKTASRLAFYLLTQKDEELGDFSKAIADLRKNIVYCKKCYNISEEDICVICQNKERDQNKIMVVEEPLDAVAMEKTDYDGVYHVLGGAISPIDGIGPDDLKIKELVERLKKMKGKVEVILATDPSLEGEATAMQIAKEIQNAPARIATQSVAGGNLKMQNVTVTRIARGLPIGGDLEYTDELTLARSLEGRKEYN